MDGVPCQIEIGFHFDSLKLDPSFNPFDEDWQIELGIVGDFFIRVDGKTLYQESGFCLVEFAVSVSKWLSLGDGVQDFTYTSIESDEAGLVWIKQYGDKWKLGSVHQEYNELCLFKLDQIRLAVQTYIKNLIHYVPTHLKSKVFKIIA